MKNNAPKFVGFYVTDCGKIEGFMFQLQTVLKFVSFSLIQELLQMHKCWMFSKEACGEGLPQSEMCNYDI